MNSFLAPPLETHHARRPTFRLLVYTLRRCTAPHHRQHVPPSCARRRADFGHLATLSGSRAGSSQRISEPSARCFTPPGRGESGVLPFSAEWGRSICPCIPGVVVCNYRLCTSAHMHQPIFLPLSAPFAPCSRRDVHQRDLRAVSHDRACLRGFGLVEDAWPG